MKNHIKELIESYAEVYTAFEKLQSVDNRIFPSGDQKTGVIAEYYAKCYIDHTFRVISDYADPGESHDLSYTKNGKKIKVQVKAVSAHSQTRTIAPLNLKLIDRKAPFDYLYLISLNEYFIPVGFYINTYIKIRKRLEQRADIRERILGATMKGESLNSKEKAGHWLFNFSDNKVKELSKIIS
ncbi:MAG: hypothetical protein IPP81_20275 [Chitinophagaceae bacterium]|nr:hypothetical protein [Chitinophagaceae bacterium]